jgi:hypothetical protein
MALDISATHPEINKSKAVVDARTLKIDDIFLPPVNNIVRYYIPIVTTCQHPYSK